VPHAAAVDDDFGFVHRCQNFNVYVPHLAATLDDDFWVPAPKSNFTVYVPHLAATDEAL
jgi:hypothetical protein